MAIYLLRHAKTANNTKHIISGRSDIGTLPDINVEINGSKFFEYIYCSTAKRCKDTVAMLKRNAYNGEIFFLEELQERCVGILEGMEKKVALELYPNLFYGNKLSVTAQVDGGETIQNVRDRVEWVVQEVLIKGANNDVLICSHNQTLKVIYAMIENIEITDQYWVNTNFMNGIIVKV